MNAFEQGTRKMIPAVLVYARFGQEVLMMHRVTRGSADFHAGKWNGVGGKSEPDESAQQTAAREFFEEASLAIAPARFQALGVLHFPNFKPLKGEDWLVHVFDVAVSDVERASVPAACDEGTLHWVPGAELLNRPLWEGDRHFLPRVLARKPFVGTFWYQDGGLQRFALNPLI
jgi:8-oxo-dGTP diphosphatase